MTKLIVVFGATGAQGGAVAKTFLADAAWSVRAITRSSNSAKAKALAEKGAEVIEADVDKPETLSKALAGAHAIFLVTDFWTPYNAAFPRYMDLDRGTGEYAYNLEIKRGQAVVDAAATLLSEEKKLEIFVWSTLPSFKELSGGKYTYVYHFDSKAQVTRYIEREQPELWKKTSLLNMGFYLNVMIEFQDVFAPKKEADGSLTFRHSGSPQALHPFIEPQDAGVLAALLINSAPGKNLLGAVEMTSWSKLMPAISKQIGITINLKEIPVTGRDKDLPGGLGREAFETTSSSAEFGWGDTFLMPTDIDPNVKLISIQEYIKNEQWDKML